MSVNQTLTSSFKLELLSGYHAFSSDYRTADTFKLALYNSPSVLDATTTRYLSIIIHTTSGVVVGGLAQLFFSVRSTPIPVGSSIVVAGVVCTGFNPLVMNGTFTVLSSTNNSVTYALPGVNSVTVLTNGTITLPDSSEASGGNYAPGGQILSVITPVLSETVACVSFSPVTWTGSITANSALIYNYSQANRSVCVLNFGSIKTSANSFVITFPTNDKNNAVVRIA